MPLRHPGKERRGLLAPVSSIQKAIEDEMSTIHWVRRSNTQGGLNTRALSVAWPVTYRGISINVGPSVSNPALAALANSSSELTRVLGTPMLLPNCTQSMSG